jgi:hypothetical protein
MDNQEKVPDPGERFRGGRGQQQESPEHSATTPPAQVRKKWQRVLNGFLERGSQGFNRFEAYREMRDSCLNSSISELEIKGVVFQRREEVLPGHYGPVRCNRYWLSPDSVQRARELLA